MLLADSRAEFTQLGAQRAESHRKCRVSAHPLRCQQTNVGAIAAKPDTAGHQILVALVRHADHVIAAGIADTRAG
jgi:hypothetical protein